MNTPLISIIVPVYNTEKYLRQCLDSLLNQTYKKIEIICFNDASTDNSLNILEQYANLDNRIIVINSQINVKQGGGRNRGIKASTGEYVCFVDSDDWVECDFIEKLYIAIKTNDAEIATADYYEYRDGNLKEISHLGKKIKSSSIDIKRSILLNGCRLVTSIFNKKLFIENNLFFPENLIYEDNAIGPALFLSANKIIKIDDFLYYYRQNPISTTKSKNNYKFFDRLKTSVMAIENIEKLDNYKELTYLRTEKEWMFIKLFLLGTLFGTISLFDPIPVEKIRLLFKEMNTYNKFWRKNIYYKKQVPALRKIIINSLYYLPKLSCFCISSLYKIRYYFDKISLV